MTIGGDWGEPDGLQQAVLSLDGAGRINKCSAASHRFLGYPRGVLRGRDFSALLASAEAVLDSPSWMLRASTTASPFEKRVSVRRGDGSQLSMMLKITALVGNGRGSGFLVAIRGVTSHSGDMSHVQGAVEISQAILSGRQLDEVLHLVVSRARALLRAEAVWVSLAPCHDGIVSASGSDCGMTTVPDGVEPPDLAVPGHRLPMLVADAVETAWTSDPGLPVPRLAPVFGVTLAAAGRTLGTLYVASARDEIAFETYDLEPLQLFADQAALAITLVEVQRERTRVGAMERERLARDLHDDIVQSLYAVTLGLQTVSTRALEGDVKVQLTSLAGAVQTAIEDLGNYIFALGPSLLAGRRLDEAVLQLVRDFELRTGLVIVADVDPAAGQRLAEQGTEVIQIVREGLSNVGRHAKASTCRVSLRLQDGEAQLRMEDDGVGFDPSQQGAWRNGLRNLTERAGRLGGRLLIESAPNAGSILKIDIPLTHVGGRA
jgi:signal transduction histidine kinase